MVFPDEYVLDSTAEDLLQAQANAEDDASHSNPHNPQVYINKAHNGEVPPSDTTAQSPQLYAYEEMIMDDRRLLCQIPHVTIDDHNTTASNQDNEAEQAKELARATDRGLELLREMEGKCMYYFSGWWSYSFCYRKQIKQFHALPAGRNVPQYPPMEDPSTHSFILGQFPTHMKDAVKEQQQQTQQQQPQTEVAELHTKGGSRYLVQHLRGGTTCDLTGRDRRVEVQFHCHPQSTDQIGWIKELTTCSYLMVIYTPRLCDDVAFLPPQQDEIHDIECREILLPEDVHDWEAMREWYQSEALTEAAAAVQHEKIQIVGGIEVGGRRLVGGEGKVIEKGRVASTLEERTEAVVKRENGEVKLVSKQLLKKYELDQEKLEEMQKRLDDLAAGKDWTLEVVVENNGVIKFQGVVSDDEDVTAATAAAGSSDGQVQKGEKQKEGDVAKPETKGEGVPSENTQRYPSDETRRTEEEETDIEGEEEGSEEIFKDEL